MAPPQPAFTRRTLLGWAALLPLAGCAKTRTSAKTSSTPAPADRAKVHHRHLAELERRFDARLGVYALATGTGATVAHRADRRFAFCSTFKALAAAAVLDHNPVSHLDTVVRYSEGDLMASSSVTRRHVATGMTIRQLCDAAVRYSDGTAGNLLVRDLGGPARLQAFVRGLGDRVSRMDRAEPALAEAAPGDPRDTTSPRAFASDYRKIVLGDALPPGKRAFLRGLLERNTTGADRIRAGVPGGWPVADKTGTGGYGTINDMAIVWPPGSAPLVMAVMSTRNTKDAGYDEALIAETARYVSDALTCPRPCRRRADRR